VRRYSGHSWLGAKLYGPPPAKGASRLEQLRFVRRICVRSLVFYAPVFALLAVFGTTTVVLAVFCFLILLGGLNVVWLTRKIHRVEEN
jgi:hypothetical protein